MFRGLISDAKSASGSLITKYLTRASVAVPFAVALGFATAAITLMLVDRFGSIAAFWMIAGGFTVIGLAATRVVTVKEREEEVAEAENQGTVVAAELVSQAAMQGLMALAGALLSTPLGPGTLTAGAKMVVRNIPLMVLLALLALLLWPSQSESDAEAPDVGLGKANGMRPPAGNGVLVDE